ncbi:nucleotidyltransferase [Aquibacillus koreensis]|uniref:tRNA(Met) cytidine acetate ligase n=1 Tax=Aquibacillus koreensis TaxID=279446 RepID=A0A9X3WII3_9BACI|nr:nucleotidyltransferase [Aquibacillus koreensis]MCT2538074.1 nucleotidyltransferase [Aquibacillus koreensis]MDC3420597.1 nucleotidyltransferase [Aquibacillus koreensis]
MKACGLIVEYNPFHNGHQYHLDQAKKVTNADCMIAVMSGNFLQRGEPAIIDKYARTKIALQQGVDIVIELPFVYAVQHSDLFARGAIMTLDALKTSTVCFGSEHGEVNDFIEAYHILELHKDQFHKDLKEELTTGKSFPEASKNAYSTIGLTKGKVDLSQPNNILGFGYVKGIFQTNTPITPVTIKRYKNDFHDQDIAHSIASATSIRKELLAYGKLTSKAVSTLPDMTQKALDQYLLSNGIWHEWEKYFPLLQYRVLTMSHEELRTIHGVNEGIEHRLKRTASQVDSFKNWMETLKTKRYTWTRLQRVFVHILTNTKKDLIQSLLHADEAPYVRLLGMTQKGRAYLKEKKKQIEQPIITGFKKDPGPVLQAEERATDAYYSILPSKQKLKLRKQELEPPIILS